MRALDTFTATGVMNWDWARALLGDTDVDISFGMGGADDLLGSLFCVLFLVFRGGVRWRFLNTSRAEQNRAERGSERASEWAPCCLVPHMLYMNLSRSGLP
jgi:hypothetical protein